MSELFSLPTVTVGMGHSFRDGDPPALVRGPEAGRFRLQVGTHITIAFRAVHRTRTDPGPMPGSTPGRPVLLLGGWSSLTVPAGEPGPCARSTRTTRSGRTRRPRPPRSRGSGAAPPATRPPRRRPGPAGAAAGRAGSAPGPGPSR